MPSFIPSAIGRRYARLSAEADWIPPRSWLATTPPPNNRHPMAKRILQHLDHFKAAQFLRVDEPL